jgi:hypothetical protein
MHLKPRNHKKSACYDKLNRYITQEFEKLENEHLMKWNFFKSNGKEYKLPNGDWTHLTGYTWEGTGSYPFWEDKYIPAYINKILDSCLEISNKSSKEFAIHPNKCFQELEELFLPKIAETYHRMAIIDSRLRGDGVNIPQPIDTNGYIDKLQNEIKVRLEHYRLDAFKSLGWWLTRFRGWLAWIIGIILGFNKPN